MLLAVIAEARFSEGLPVEQEIPEVFQASWNYFIKDKICYLLAVVS